LDDSSLRRHFDSGKTSAGVEQCVLPHRIVGGWVRCALPHVKEVLACDRRGGVLADRKPDLGPVSSVQIVGRPPPDFLLAALDRFAYAAFFTESRTRLLDSTKLHRKSGFGPPILVGIQPGSSALEKTSGQRRAIAKANNTSCSLVSE
jgi:hypothetical protein